MEPRREATGEIYKTTETEAAWISRLWRPSPIRALLGDRSERAVELAREKETDR